MDFKTDIMGLYGILNDFYILTVISGIYDWDI